MRKRKAVSSLDEPHCCRYCCKAWQVYERWGCDKYETIDPDGGETCEFWE